MDAPVWVMLIAAGTFGYALRVASESMRWRPPMVAPVMTVAACLVWVAVPLGMLIVIIGWTMALR
jgi:hypothetical protein